MSPLPAEFLARWLPAWREFAELALAAARHPGNEVTAYERLAVLADKADKWPSPFGNKRDQYVGAVLIWAAKAFCRQDSTAMRQSLEGLLHEAALAFMARLERTAEKLTRDDRADAAAFGVAAFRRPRRDIDDIDDDQEPGGG